jgi:prephenate dehydratase
MVARVAHLGPSGTYSEMAALRWCDWLKQERSQSSQLVPCANIAQALELTSTGQTDFGVVPVENSIEGSVAVTLDTLWRLDNLRIQQAIVLPILHTCLSYAQDWAEIQRVYSHPPALAQCQGWLARHVPQAQCIAMSSTTEALSSLASNPTAAAIASQRAAELYQLPIIAAAINDYADNQTRFWIVSTTASEGGQITSLAFTVHANVPGALLTPLQIFAERQINLSRIESRPTKKSLGDYLFCLDLEGNLHDPMIATTLQEVRQCTEVLKIFGTYNILASS